ncbi:hypothetical protein KW787_00370 [Candidatus Pacearchaeota archaeon]|nr:hypothetical protein [Candidatus Pacearchaeota archaeon]
MNRVSIGILIFIVLSVSVVSAAECDDSQIIMRLSSNNNAHGSLWSGDYATKICYNSLFGINYSGPSPHDCSANTVITLSDITNAHASENSYSNPVCYGDLKCRVASQCSSSERIIGSISGTTNAHLAADGSYPSKICCSSALAVSVPTHAECTNNACIQVAGAGANQCTGNQECQGFHTSCQGNAGSKQCVVEQGPGTNACTFDSECNTGAHGVCSQESCSQVQGKGDDQCTSDDSCISGQHMECNSQNQCIVADGDGTNTCVSNAECGTDSWHTECINDACVIATGDGEKKCDLNQACTSNIISGIGKVYWTDLGGIKTSASNVNKTVMIVADTGFAANTPVDISIKEDDGIFGSDDIRSVQAYTNATGSAVYEWKVTDDDMTAADGVGEYLDGTAEFYFIASAGSASNQSGILTVEDIQGFDFNDIKAVISDPEHRGIYFTGLQVEFNESSSSSSHPITDYEWRIVEDDFSTTDQSFMYTFTTEGQKTITLKVADDQGHSRETQIAILVIGQPGILAYISEPFHHQIVHNKDLVVHYSANDSYVVNTNSAACPQVSCLAGNCPSKTGDYPSACSSPIDVSGTGKGFDDFTFNWSFDDNSRNNGKGNQFVSGFKQYPLSSLIYSDKLISLGLYYSKGLELNRITDRSFTLVGESQCIGGRTLVLIGDDGSELDRRSTLTSDACKGVDGIIGLDEQGRSDDCCPSAQICTTDGCIPQTVRQCNDYVNRSSCGSDIANVGNMEGGPEGKDPLWAQLGCGQSLNGLVKQCSCFWDDSKASCGLNATLTKPINQYGNVDAGICSAGSCLYTTNSQTQCTDGVLKTEVSALFSAGTCSESTSQQECESSGQTYDLPCGQSTIELPFFGMQEFTISLIAIFIVYFILKFLYKK